MIRIKNPITDMCFFVGVLWVVYCVTRRVTLRGHGLLNITNHNGFILMQHATKHRHFVATFAKH